VSRSLAAPEARAHRRLDTRGLRSVVAVSVAAGIGLGLLSFASDYVLPHPWAMIGNVTGTWVLVAFAVGAICSERSLSAGIIAGLLALLLATPVYYLVTSLMWPSSSVGLLLFGLVVWSVVAAIVGPVAGGAGAVWRRGALLGRTSWWLRPAAVAGLSAVLAAEAAVYVVVTLDWDPVVVTAEALLGAALPLVLLRSFRDRVAAWVGLVVLVAVGLPVMVVGIPFAFRLAGGGW
jgi:hypothetical protein